jgi:hypothetical protein
VLKAGEFAREKRLNIRVLDSDGCRKAALVDHRPEVDRAEKVRVHRDVHFGATDSLVEPAGLDDVVQGSRQRGRERGLLRGEKRGARGPLCGGG